MELCFDLLLTVRSLVLTIGQRDGAAWWSSAFLTPAGERFLTTPFPRSSFWSAFHAASVAAARHHDERIGAGRTVHLFRLGQELELAVRDRILRRGWRPDYDQSSGKAMLLEVLRKFVDAPGQKVAAGPIRISDTARFVSPKTLAKAAGLYAAAFEDGFQILPYGSEA